MIDELARRGTALRGPYIHCAFYGGLNVGENGRRRRNATCCRKLARGELLFAYGLSEPDVGGDLASVTTRRTAARDGRPNDSERDQALVHRRAVCRCTFYTW